MVRNQWLMRGKISRATDFAYKDVSFCCSCSACKIDISQRLVRGYAHQPLTLSCMGQMHIMMHFSLNIIKEYALTSLDIGQYRMKIGLKNGVFLGNIWWLYGKVIPLHSLFGNTTVTDF